MTYILAIPAFHMMYSACKLNKQDDNIQPWHTPFPIWSQSVVPCLVLSLLELHTGFSESVIDKDLLYSTRNCI